MFSIEEIEDIMADTAEAAEKQREISALISGSLTADDESDVLKELDALVKEEDKDAALELPDVPEGDLTPGKKRNSLPCKSNREEIVGIV